MSENENIFIKQIQKNIQKNLLDLDDIFGKKLEPIRCLFVGECIDSDRKSFFTILIRSILEHILYLNSSVHINFVNYKKNLFTSFIEFGFNPELFNLNYVSTMDNFDLIYNKIISDTTNVQILIISNFEIFNDKIIDLILNYTKYNLILLIEIDYDEEIFELLNKFEVLVFKDKEIFLKCNSLKTNFIQDNLYFSHKKKNLLKIKNIKEIQMDFIKQKDAIVVHKNLIKVVSWDDVIKNYSFNCRSILDRNFVDKFKNRLGELCIQDVETDKSSKKDIKKIIKEVNKYKKSMKKIIANKNPKEKIFFDTDYMVEYLRDSNKIKSSSDSSSYSGFGDGIIASVRKFDVKKSDLYSKLESSSESNSMSESSSNCKYQESLTESKDTTDSSFCSNNSSDSNDYMSSYCKRKNLTPSEMVKFLSENDNPNITISYGSNPDVVFYQPKFNLTLDKNSNRKVNIKINGNDIDVNII